MKDEYLLKEHWDEMYLKYACVPFEQLTSNHKKQLEGSLNFAIWRLGKELSRAFNELIKPFVG